MLRTVYIVRCILIQNYIFLCVIAIARFSSGVCARFLYKNIYSLLYYRSSSSQFQLNYYSQCIRSSSKMSRLNIYSSLLLLDMYLSGSHLCCSSFYTMTGTHISHITLRNDLHRVIICGTPWSDKLCLSKLKHKHAFIQNM